MEIADYKMFKEHEGHAIMLIHYSQDESGRSPEQLCVICPHGFEDEGDVVLASVKPGDIRIGDRDFAKVFRALECVHYLEDLLWPDFDNPEAREWNSETMTEVANCLGTHGFGPHAKKQECQCSMDPGSVVLVDDDGTFDCKCYHCGRDGSFQFDENGVAEIQWEDS
jgi:hypothetical protein